MIKPILKTIFAIVVVVGLLFFVAYNETHYAKTGTITQRNGISTFKDHRGNEWDFYSDKIIPANANIKAKFFTNNTLNYIYDDQLISYEIIGYVDEIEINF